MRPAATLAAFTGALALVLGGAYGVGQAVGPVGTAAAPQHEEQHGSSTSPGAEEPGAAAGHTDAGTHAGTAPAALPPGLSSAQDGYALRLASTTAAAGTPFRLAFTVSGPDGAPVTRYTEEHERDLHLVVVRRDGTGFQHLHPELVAGTWSVPVTLPTAGPWKVLADFRPEGHDAGLVLAADLQVPGDYRPAPPARTARSAQADGYTVTVEGDLVAGTESGLALRVTRDGRPVTDLQPYLGARGHLVALRDSDLAYLHVHPTDDGGTGPVVRFAVEVPSAGAYRLYLDFRHGDAVRTAALALTTEEER